MRRNTVVALTTVSGLALLIAYPSSHDALVAATSPAVPSTSAEQSGAPTTEPAVGSGTPTVPCTGVSDHDGEDQEGHDGEDHDGDDRGDHDEEGDDRGGDAACVGGAVAPTTVASPATPAAAAAPATLNGTFTGSAVANRYGTVQVQITLASGRIVSAKALQTPNGDAKSRQINAYAVPALNASVVNTQGRRVDAVGGATVTSGSYRTSLQAALDAARV